MNLDEYKELMKFHLLLCDENLIGMNYAAVDEGGALHTYEFEPRIYQYDPLTHPSGWTPLEETKEAWSSSNYKFIIWMLDPEDWTKTLIKL